jgi:tRNA nucleotidyltransferase (CCA-adding enzyme)
VTAADRHLAETVLARLRDLPHGARLLRALDRPSALGGVHLVGGAVRDLLRGDEPGELDLVVEPRADAAEPWAGVAVAAELGRRLDGAGSVHERFGTATLDLADGTRVDVATAREERYPRPGALPDVLPADLPADMARRDFTLNAIAVGISEDRRGVVHHAPDALQDLERGVLRVLHDASFVDDPTRLWRLARYATRLGADIDDHTAGLAAIAVDAGAPATAGPARMGSELLLALREPDPVHVLGVAEELEVLDVELRVDEPVLRRALELLPPDGSPERLLLAGLASTAEAPWRSRWLAGIHAPGAPDVLDAAEDPQGLAGAMRGARRSELRRLLRRRSPEAVALAGAHDAEDEARAWLDDLRHVGLQIDGEDLIAAGVPRGPEIGRRLDAALARKLDDGLATREDELAAALDVGSGG